MEYKRMTTDNPKGSVEAMLNFAKAKDGNVILSYAGGEESIDLCEYLFEEAKKLGYNCVSSAEGILEGDCLFCDCIINVLYTAAVQAAELHGRLKMLEDKIENGKLIFKNECSKCRYANVPNDKFPCSQCSDFYESAFESEKKGEEE